MLVCEVLVIGLGVIGLSEANTVFCHCIERRSLNGFVAVAVNVVGAQRVDGDQENVGLSRLLLRLSCPQRGSNQQEKRSGFERPSRVSD